MTGGTGAEAGEPSPPGGSGTRELLSYRSAQGRWVVAAMVLGSSVAGIDSAVVAVALPAIGRNLRASFQDLQWTVLGYTLTLASLILVAGWLSDHWGRRVFWPGWPGSPWRRCWARPRPASAGSSPRGPYRVSEAR